jgi:predicted O-methyltransferase YrrM
MTVYNENTSAYISALFAAEDEVLAHIRQQTPARGLPDIGITPEEGRFLHLLVRGCHAGLALEIGTLGGYSGVWITRGLAPGGKLITLEKSGAHAAVAREHFDLAGLSEQVEIRQGEAHQLLPGLRQKAPFDFIFIDADKPGYLAYYEWSVEHVRTGGVIAAHNALWGGAVAGDHHGEGIDLMREFNQTVAQDPRVTSTIFPAGDGTLVAVRLA